MNTAHPLAAFKTAVLADPYSSGAERAVIAGCLARPELIAEVAAKLVPADFEGDFHRRAVDILIGLHGEGRKPSIEALVAVTGDDEIAPNLTVRGYLRGLIADSIGTLLLPFDDALETVKDAAQRKALSEAGNDLMFGATSGGKSVASLAG
jgi:replicative DNA helicase